ncbi:hypothetical protein NQZ68_034826, partial [Dissostichus eleginoides]
PAEVPMMSPHGSIPPIHVPPGYISQVLEDNTGVRRVVVTPHPGDLSPHQYYQHHLPPMYGDPEIIPVYGMSNYIGREETYSKPQPKKIKERQLERQNRLNSPPSPLYKGSLGPAHNGYSNKSHAPLAWVIGSGGGLGSPGGKKPERRLRSSPRNSEPDTHTQETDVGSVPSVPPSWLCIITTADPVSHSQKLGFQLKQMGQHPQLLHLWFNVIA